MIAQSSCETEFIAIAFALKEVLWIEELLNEIGVLYNTSVIFCDNLGAVKIAENQGSSGRTKHISIGLELIKQKVNEGKIIVQYIKGTNNIADVFTKPLGRLNFTRLINKIMNEEIQHQGGVLKEVLQLQDEAEVQDKI